MNSRHRLSPHLRRVDRLAPIRPRARLAIPANNEWTWQLNRHAEWTRSRAYLDSDEKYAREFVAQMTAWARVPHAETRRIARDRRGAPSRPASAPPRSGRTLVPLRTFPGYDGRRAPLLRAIDRAPPDAFPHRQPACHGRQRLFHVGVVPGIHRRSVVARYGGKLIYAELNNQVIRTASGGAFQRLSPRQPEQFPGGIQIARLNERELPADFLTRLEKMYDFDVYGAMPTAACRVWDGNYYQSQSPRRGRGVLPGTRRFRWYATNGRDGKPPAETSHAFRGQAIT